MSWPRRLVLFAGVASALLLAGCGGGSSGSITGPPPSSTQNVQPIAVNTGPTYQAGDYPYANGAFTSVTICSPGTTTCQTIGGILVDTGSDGLRVLSSALTISLPQQTQGGNPIGECYPFVGAVTWGPVQTADVKMASETGNSVPIQVIGASTGGITSTAPSSCTSSGPAEEDLSSLGANGILGIGVFAQDCGVYCTNGTTNLGWYYSCPSSGCTVTTVGVNQQVENPVAAFSTDNNGFIIQLPALGGSPPVASSVSGSLIFGIGTQSNNTLNGQTVLFVDPTYGNFSVNFPASGSNSVLYNDVGFLDSGSGAYFFADPTTANMPVCSTYSSLYCPSAETAFSATNVGYDGTQNTFNFVVDNADSLLNNNPNAAAFGSLAGPSTTTAGPSSSDYFDWGLPFFYGRSVYEAIEGAGTPAGPGPYFAY